MKISTLALKGPERAHTVGWWSAEGILEICWASLQQSSIEATKILSQLIPVVVVSSKRFQANIVEVA